MQKVTSFYLPCLIADCIHLNTKFRKGAEELPPHSPQPAVCHNCSNVLNHQDEEEDEGDEGEGEGEGKANSLNVGEEGYIKIASSDEDEGWDDRDSNPGLRCINPNSSQSYFFDYTSISHHFPSICQVLWPIPHPGKRPVVGGRSAPEMVTLNPT